MIYFELFKLRVMCRWKFRAYQFEWMDFLLLMLLAHVRPEIAKEGDMEKVER